MIHYQKSISMSSKNYVKHIKANAEASRDYYLKSFVKTDQQRLLEHLLRPDIRPNLKIGDFAAGAGSLSYHLNSIFRQGDFFLFDLNDQALKLAKENIQAPNFHFIKHDLHKYDKKWRGHFDYVFCWQTLLIIEKPEVVLRNLLKTCKKGGKLYLSALFNLDHDVDIYANIIDHTRKNVKDAISYNTYCKRTVQKWLDGYASSFEIHPFKPSMDFRYDGKGIGTNTVMTMSNERLQISGGMLMNWGILEIEK